MRLHAWILFSVLAVAPPAFAAEEEDEKDPLEGNVTFGFLGTSGNTETSSLNTGFEASYTLERWTHKASAAAIYSEDNSVTTAEAYEAAWISGWDLTERDFLFGRLSWRKDRFGGFDTQFSQTLGYGRKVLTGEVHTLTVGLGAGARQSEDQFGVSSEEAIFTGDVVYKWKFSETAEFDQTVAVEAGEDNTYSESVTSVKTTLIGAFSLAASYTIRHNSDVPIGTEKKDTRTAISLQYDF